MKDVVISKNKMIDRTEKLTWCSVCKDDMHLHVLGFRIKEQKQALVLFKATVKQLSLVVVYSKS